MFLRVTYFNPTVSLLKMYLKNTLSKGLAYNFLNSLYESNLILKQVIEFENITM